MIYLKLLIGVIFFCLISACEPRTNIHVEYPIPIVNTDVLKSKTFFYQPHIYTGLISAGSKTNLSFELSGKIKTKWVDIGDRVEKGQILAKLHTELLESQQSQLLAKLSQNNTELNLAKRTLNRSKALDKDSYISSQRLDEIASKQQNLLAMKRALEADLEAISLKLGKSSLVAPYAGIISKSNIDIGAVIAQGEPIFSLVGNEKLYAHIGVDSAIAKKLKLNDKVSLKIADNDVNAEIVGISAELAPLTHTIEIRLELPQTINVFSGETARLYYQQKHNKTGFWVPISALTQGMRERWNLFIITKKQNKNFIEGRDVQVLYINDNQAYITGDIKENEIFITQGLHKFVAGQEVRLNNQGSANQ